MAQTEDQDIAVGAEHRVYLGRLAKLEAQVTQVHQELKAIQVILEYLDGAVSKGFLEVADIRAQQGSLRSSLME